MKIFLGLAFYIYMANVSTKAVSLPKHMKVACTTNALPHIIDGLSNESDTMGNPKLDNTTHATEQWVKKYCKVTNANGNPYLSGTETPTVWSRQSKSQFLVKTERTNRCRRRKEMIGEQK